MDDLRSPLCLQALARHSPSRDPQFCAFRCSSRTEFVPSGNAPSPADRDQPSHRGTLARCPVPRIGSRCKGGEQDAKTIPYPALPNLSCGIHGAFRAIGCALVWYRRGRNDKGVAVPSTSDRMPSGGSECNRLIATFGVLVSGFAAFCRWGPLKTTRAYKGTFSDLTDTF